MRILFKNHEEYQGVSDVLRLYFQTLPLDREQNEISVDDKNDLNLDITIVSELNQPVSKEAMRDIENKNLIQVKTYVSDQTLSISEKVIPSVIRREIKRQMYFILSNLLNITYPWGSLTGIRPTQIVLRTYFENDCDLVAAKQDLMEKWFVSEEKADICLETALAEYKILENISQDLPMLYIGIPFCRTRCAYCSFITRDATEQAGKMDIYVDALIQEIKQIALFMKEKDSRFQALYIGGGTPTALSDSDFTRLITNIKKHIPLTKYAEITVEAGRPDSISQRKLELIKSLGKTRICINPQTMHDKTLELIGRDHSVDQVLDAMKEARSLDFDAINMDLILGLPGESKKDFMDSLHEVLDLEPESITIHTMALKRSAFLEEKYNQKYMELRFPDKDLSDAFRQAVTVLKSKGYLPYYMYRQKNVRGGLENIGFAKPGYACTYNVGMMSDAISVYGLGSGSATKIVTGDLVERIVNPKDLNTYCQRIDEISHDKIDFISQRKI